ncbi:hypothetical protein KC347_g231 [Hortaea werneckii]|nr:hypothetical protein KC347_g231 [Hortaea werneckii]
MGLGLADVRLEERYFSGGRVDGRRVHEVCTFCGMSYAPISLVHSCGFFGPVPIWTPSSELAIVRMCLWIAQWVRHAGH